MWGWKADFLSCWMFFPPDVLSLRTFCPFGCFVPSDVLSRRTFCCRMLGPSGCFVPLDVLSLRTLSPGHFFYSGRFFPRTFCRWTFVCRTFCRWTFCLGTIINGLLWWSFMLVSRTCLAPTVMSVSLSVDFTETISPNKIGLKVDVWEK
jgi:hypothetical protein